MDTLHDQELGRLYESLTLEKVIEDTNGVDMYAGRGCFSSWWAYPKRGRTTIYFNQDGQKHRLYGPAILSPHYDLEEWYKEGKLHREGGPARRHRQNTWWFHEGKLHRTDGPAVIIGGHPKEYWIHGEKYSPKEYKKEIARRKNKGHYKI